MKKILVTMLFLCFALAGVLAKTNRELIIESTNRPLMPHSLVEIPKVFQSDASLSIVLPETTSYVTGSIINKEYIASYNMTVTYVMIVRRKHDGKLFKVKGKWSGVQGTNIKYEARDLHPGEILYQENKDAKGILKR